MIGRSWFVTEESLHLHKASVLHNEIYRNRIQNLKGDASASSAPAPAPAAASSAPVAVAAPAAPVTPSVVVEVTPVTPVAPVAFPMFVTGAGEEAAHAAPIAGKNEVTVSSLSENISVPEVSHAYIVSTPTQESTPTSTAPMSPTVIATSESVRPTADGVRPIESPIAREVFPVAIDLTLGQKISRALLNVSIVLVVIMALTASSFLLTGSSPSALVSFATGQFDSLFGVNPGTQLSMNTGGSTVADNVTVGSPSTNVAAVNQNTPSQGIAVVPSAGSVAADATQKQNIQSSFSDQVEVHADKSGTAGVITPVFKGSLGKDFLYVMVPVKKTPGSGQSPP